MAKVLIQVETWGDLAKKTGADPFAAYSIKNWPFSFQLLLYASKKILEFFSSLTNQTSPNDLIQYDGSLLLSSGRTYDCPEAGG